MAWKINGQYFENCSCDVPCPCTVSLDLGADRDLCNAFLVFQVESGEVDGVDVSDLTVAAMIETPKVMSEIKVGDDGEMEVQEIVSFGKEDGKPARLTGIFHPAGDDLKIAKATKSRVSAFGIDFAFEGGSGFANPFAWAA